MFAAGRSAPADDTANAKQLMWLSYFPSNVLNCAISRVSHPREWRPLDRGGEREAGEGEGGGEGEGKSGRYLPPLSRLSRT